MKCPNCGKENRPVALFCQYCGTSLAAGEPSTTASEKAAEQTETVSDLWTTGVQAEEATLIQLPEAPASVPAEPEAGPLSETELGTVPAEGAPIQAPAGTDLGEDQAEEADGEIPSIEEAAGPPIEPPEPVSLEAETLEGAPGTAPEAPSVGVRGTQESAPEIAPEPASREAAQAPVETPDEETLASEDEAAVEAGEMPAEALDQEEPAPTSPGPVEAAYPEDEGWVDVQELASAGVLPWSDMPGPMLPLELGTVVNGRYQVIAVLSEEEQQTLYRVRDLQRCPRCEFTDNAPDEAFCASCGAIMDEKPEALMLARSVERSEEPVEAEAEDHFAEGDRSYWIWRESQEVVDVEGPEETMRLIVGQRSDTGRVRELDEDELLVFCMSCTREAVTHQLGLFVVADGMGGHEAGEVASRIAVQTLTDVLIDEVFTPELSDSPLLPQGIAYWMSQAIEQANDQVYLERHKRENDMGTTVTAALVRDWTLYLAHVGDCRAYRWGQDGLEQLTTDHSLVASMIAAGTAQPDEIYTHPQRSVIYRCVGDRPTVEVDVSTLTLSPGDRLVLCCDGLWEMIHNEGIEEAMLREADPQAACDLLVEQANLTGGMDNISVIVIQL